MLSIMNKDLQQVLLETLSFYEPMSLEFILLDLNDHFLKENPNLTTEDLLATLHDLNRQKKIKKIKKQGQLHWLRVFPKKSLWHRIKAKLNLF